MHVRLIHSNLINFFVGKDEELFSVHSSAVTATSQQLDALVNANRVSSKFDPIFLDDIEPEDFARYVEYAYRYDYTVPSWVEDDNFVKSAAVAAPDHIETNGHADSADVPAEVWSQYPPPCEPKPEPEPEPPVQDDPWGAMPTVKKNKKKGKLAAQPPPPEVRATFESRTYLSDSEPSAWMLSNFSPKGNSSATQDFKPVFLAHARLYTFADMHLIEPFKRLVLHKLHQTLIKFELFERRIGDVVELARYAYEHGEDRNADGTIDALRKLVVDYMACKVYTIGKNPRFEAFLEEGGQFVSDYWRVVYAEEFATKAQ